MVPLPYQHFLLTGYTPLTPAIVNNGEAHISGEDFRGVSLFCTQSSYKHTHLCCAGSQQSLSSAASSLARASSIQTKGNAPTKIIQVRCECSLCFYIVLSRKRRRMMCCVDCFSQSVSSHRQVQVRVQHRL